MKMLVVAFAIALPSFSQEVEKSPTDLFRDALYAEEVEGDNEAALQAYRELTTRFDEQRALAARTLLRQAECLRKLQRDDEAITTYQTLLARYPEQEDLAKLATENLVALGQQPASTPGEAVNVDPEDERIAELKKRIAQSPDLMNAPAPGEKLPPLHQASIDGELKVAKFLIEQGADVLKPWGESLKNVDNTPLLHASFAGHLAVCELLLDHGGENGTSGPDSLYAAIRKDRDHITDLLLKAGIKPGIRALEAASNRYEEKPELLGRLLPLASTEEINKPFPDNPAAPGFRTLLEHAVVTMHAGKIQLLVDNRADPNFRLPHPSRPERKVGPMEIALEVIIDKPGDESRRTLETLFKAGGKFADSQTIDTHPLFLAIRDQSPTSLKLVLQNGGNPNLRIEERTPLQQALGLLSPEYSGMEGPGVAQTREKARAIIDILLEAGAKWDECAPDIVFTAVRADSPGYLEQILSSGIFPNIKNEAEQTPADLAIEIHHAEILKVLLRNGATYSPQILFSLVDSLPNRPPGGTNRTTSTPIPSRQAANSGSMESDESKNARLVATLKVVLASRPDLESITRINVQLEYRWRDTLLAAVCNRDCTERKGPAYQFLSLLLEAGANPNGQTDVRQEHPRFSGHPLNLLLAENGSTQLRQDPAIPADAISLLLSHGANPALMTLSPVVFVRPRGELREGATDVFLKLWHSIHYSEHNETRKSAIWISRGLPGFQEYAEAQKNPTLRRPLPPSPMTRLALPQSYPFFLSFSEKEATEESPVLGDVLQELEREHAGKFELDIPLAVNRIDGNKEQIITLDPGKPEDRAFHLQWGDIIELP